MSSEPPPPPTGSRAPLPRFFAAALSAAALLAVLIAALLHFSPALTSSHAPAAALPNPPPLTVPISSAGDKSAGDEDAQETPPTSAVPLTVILSSAGEGKHVRVGTPVMLSAYAALPPGASATVAISCTRRHGSSSLLALAQGSLVTVSWTPDQPGQYEFTASALDSRKVSVLSRRVSIAADPAPVLSVPAAPVVSPVPPPVRVAVAAPAEPSARSRREPAARRPAIPGKSAPPRPTTKQPASPAYHVAAGAFIVRPVAETLAEALRRRGFHAVVRHGPLLYRKPSYVVETGSYPNPADAYRQRDTLRHDGYPAYLFRP